MVPGGGLRGGMRGAGGVCMVLGDVCGAGEGGLCGAGGVACMVLGGCVVPGCVCGAGGHVWCRGCAWCGGMCGAGGGQGVCVGYDEIQSMSGQYASYWNAFLFEV